MGSMPTGMVGRRAELSRLHSLVADAAERSTALLVWGEAGIGKTRLVEDLETHAADRGFRILRGGSSPLSTDVPYAPIQAAVSAVAHAGTGRGPGAPLNRTEWYARLDQVVSAHESAAGTLVVVEDMHWADAASLGYLAHLSRNLPPDGLVLAMTFRDEGSEDLHQAWLAEQLRHPGVVGIALRALSEGDTIELGRRLDPGMSERRARELHERSGGNPYLAVELAHAAPDEALTGTLRQVLRVRLRDVGAQATQVVAAAGAITRPSTDEELYAAVGDETAVRTAHELGLLEASPGAPGRFRARHPVVAELAYESLLPDQRRVLHARLAVRLEDLLRADAAAADVAEVAEHHLRAGHADDSLVWAVRAAEAAERECAFAEAGRWYSVAVDGWLQAPALTGLVPARELLVESAGRNLGVAGRHEAVIDVLGPFLDPDEEEHSAVNGVALLVHRSWARFVQGDTDGARGDLDRAVADAQDGDVDASVQADVHAQRAVIEATCSRWEVAEHAARRASALGLESGNLRAQGRADAVLGTADLTVHGQVDRGLALLQRGLDVAWDLGEPDDFSLAAVCLQAHYVGTGQPMRGVTVSQQLRHRLRQLAPDGHWMDGMMRAIQIEALVATGAWDEAVTIGAEGPDVVGFTDMALAVVHALRGDFIRARTSLRDGARLDRRDQPQFFVIYHEARSILALQENDPRRALGEARLAAEVCAEYHDIAVANRRLLLTGLRAAVLLGDGEAFDRLLESIGLVGPDRVGPVAAAQVEAERSVLQGSGDPEQWEACAAGWAGLGMPYEAAAARVRVAEALLRGTGGRPGAAIALSAALTSARELGARPLQEAVTSLARTARLRLESDRAGVAPGPTVLGLTEREQQVLALVAQGRTNREIGESLFMSPKTASVHVTHVLQKLGVSTRVQAATVAAMRGLLPPEALAEPPSTPSRRN